MNKNGFFVTLPSNASQLVYPNNKIWQFRTKLAKPLILQEPYEVGLIEIQYPRVWNSFTENDAKVDFIDTKTKMFNKLRLTVGSYNTIDSIVKEYNMKCAANPTLAHITMTHNPITNKILFLGGDGWNIVFRGRLAEILGFIRDSVFEIHIGPHLKCAAPHPADIHGGRYNIFIYSDIVDYQLVGDSHVPLLRCINISDESKRMPTLSYDSPHYTSLARSSITDIQIELRDDQNQHIPFSYGKVIVKLHFRPVKQH